MILDGTDDALDILLDDALDILLDDADFGAAALACFPGIQMIKGVMIENDRDAALLTIMITIPYSVYVTHLVLPTTSATINFCPAD